MPFRASSLLRPHHPQLRLANHRPNRMQGASLFYGGYQRFYSTTNEPPFTYLLGASAAGKNTRLKPAEHGTNFWTQSFIQREPSFFTSLQKYSGEDAFFMSHIARSTRHVSFAIADGVGGWQDQGIDPAKFSHGLTRYMAEATFRPEKERDLRPANILEKGFKQVKADKKVVAGGSTATVATALPNGQMEVANLGDSGFVILSPGRVSFKSEPQTHAFNTPYQLSKLTPKMEQQRAIFGGSRQIAEEPSAADVTHHSLRHGNVAVFASDGVWDNLSAMEILDTVSSIMEQQDHWAGSTSKTTESKVQGDSLRRISKDTAPEKDLAGQLAYAVMRQAKIASLDQKRDGPFAKEVKRHYPNENWHGGKVDDICVLVCIAVQDGAGDWIPKAKL